MANTLMRWDPTSEFQHLRTAMDRLFDQSVGRAVVRDDELETYSIGLDVKENGDSYVVSAAIPGVDPKDVEINVNDDVLTISGSFEQKTESEEEHYIRRELRSGSFHRSLRLPPTVDAENAQAQFEHGMLELRLPKRPESRSRSFKITPQGVIQGEGQSETNQS